MSDSDTDVAVGSSDPPGRGVIALLLPCMVIVATLALLGWSAWPIMKPAREVRVTQAVFDRSTAVVETAASNSNPSGHRAMPTVQAAGWLEAEPFFVACTALADGVVESIEVLEGDRVEAGQIVARLVAEDSQLRLQQADAELANAEARLSMAQAEHDAAQRSWEEPVDLRRRVATGKAAVAESQAELAQLPALVDVAQATLNRFEEELQLVERSYRAGAANEIEVVIIRARAAAQRAEHQAVKARKPILAARVDRLHAELRAAERDLELRIEDRRRLDTAQAMVARAAAEAEHARILRDEAALELDRMVIRAPITGYVQQRLKVPGDKAVRMMDDPHSAHIVHLYDPQRIQVRVDVPLADASHVFAGQACEVIVEVLPDRVFQGEVLRVTHEADLQKNTLQVKVKVLNPDPILRPEMLTRVKFLPTHELEGEDPSQSTRQGNRLLLPEAAVTERNGQPMVWMVTNRRHGRGVLRAMRVEPVARSQGMVTVLGDLQPGALLSLDTNDLEDGQTVLIQTQPANRTGGGS